MPAEFPSLLPLSWRGGCLEHNSSKTLNSTASAAANGIAGLTFPILTGILVHPIRAWANFYLNLPPAGH